MQISVKTATKIPINLDVDSKDTIKNIKEKIQSQEGVPVDMQSLYLEKTYLCMSEKIYLEDSKSLQDYNIIENSVLGLVMRLTPKTQIIIKTLVQKSIQLDVNLTDTIKIVKEKIHDQEGVLPYQQHLYFNGVELEDVNTLNHYNIMKDYVIDLLIRL